MIPKALLRSLYDVQGQRIQTGNRIVAEIKLRLGQEPGASESRLAKEAKDYLGRARAEYRRIADAFVLNRADQYLKVDYGEQQIISDAAMLIFVQIYVKQLEYEGHMQKVIAQVVKQHPLWEAFLKDVVGVGPLMAAVVLTEFDIRKAKRISNFWSYAGLDVASDGRGRGRYKEHLTEVEYTDSDGKAATRLGITFNPFLKTKLVGVLGSSFIKQSAVKCPYRRVYDDYKRRLENHPKHKEKTKGHRHNMAVRYMVKMFVQDMWLAWRTLENLPVTAPYSEDKLGIRHAV